MQPIGEFQSYWSRLVGKGGKPYGPSLLGEEFRLGGCVLGAGTLEDGSYVAVVADLEGEEMYFFAEGYDTMEDALRECLHWIADQPEMIEAIKETMDYTDYADWDDEDW